jgi:hypothetical protein
LTHLRNTRHVYYTLIETEAVVSIRYNYWLVVTSLNCEGQNENSRTIAILHYSTCSGRNSESLTIFRQATNNIMAANWSSLNIPTIANFLFINLFGPRTNQLDLTKCAILWLAEGRRSAEVTACTRWKLWDVSNIYDSRLKLLLWFIFDIIHLTRLMLKYICIMYLFLV